VSSGAVGALEDCLNLNLLSIASVEGLFDSGRDHAVGVLQQELLRVITNALSTVRVGGESAMLEHVLLYIFDVETIRVVSCRVVLDDSGDFTAILLDELGSPVADSTETLNNEGLTLDARGEAAAVDEGLGVEQLADGIVDAEASGLSTASNTTLGDEFASAAALSVDILLTFNVDIGILDPGHDLLIGAHIRAEAINLGTDKALLDELHGVLAGHSLDLGQRVLAGVNLDTTLGAAEGNISDGKLEGHERSQGLDLLQIDAISVTSTTLDGELVGGVLGSVAGDGLEGAVVSAERDVEPDDGLASSDQREVLLIDASHVGGLVIEQLDLLEETGLLVFVNLLSELLGSAELARHGFHRIKEMIGCQLRSVTYLGRAWCGGGSGKVFAFSMFGLCVFM